jgi:hypothetical protein
MIATKYKIKDNVVFKPYGKKSLITNENLTDAIAEMFIAKDETLLGKVFEKVSVKKEEKKEVKKKK